MKVATKFFILFSGILLFSSNSLQAEGSRWANDILIYEGAISCFDVDYTMDGTMYLGFQKDESPNYPVCFYTSQDHGYTWDLRYETSNPVQRWSKMRILVGEPVHNWFFCFFIAPAADSNFYVWRIDTSFTGTGEYSLIGEIPIENFDVTRTLEDNYTIYAAFLTGTQPWPDDALYIFTSTDYGETWQDDKVLGSLDGFDREFSIAYGPPSNIYLAAGYYWDKTVQDSLEICIWSKINDSWDAGHRITHNNKPEYDPHVAASNDPNNPAIWIADTYQCMSNDVDLNVWSVPSPDSISGHWNYTLISGTMYMSEYWGDIKSYKEPGNPYVNMAWIYDDGSSIRDVHWTWSGGDDPTHWQDDRVINENMAHPWPFGAAPRIVYSPGSPVGGGGVVYAGFGGWNLYFDAPWVTGVEEEPSSEFPLFSLYPNLLTTKSPINLSLSKAGLVEVSLYDVSGRVVDHLGPVFWNEGTHSILPKQSTTGIYFLELKLNNHLIGRKKLVMVK